MGLRCPYNTVRVLACYHAVAYKEAVCVHDYEGFAPINGFDLDPVRRLLSSNYPGRRPCLFSLLLIRQCCNTVSLA